MPAWVMVMAPLGVLLLVAITWWLGGWKTARLADEGAALRRLRLDMPDFQADQILLAKDGSAALLREAGSGRLVAVAANGDGFFTRDIQPAQAAAARFEDGHQSLVIDAPDFSAPRIKLPVTDPAQAQAWITRLKTQGA